MFYHDPYFILLIPAFILAMYAQIHVRNTYARFSRVPSNYSGLYSTGIITDNEIQPTRKVLNAAALTYLAATAVAIVHLIRLVLLRQNRR